MMCMLHVHMHAVRRQVLYLGMCMCMGMGICMCMLHAQVHGHVHVHVHVHGHAGCVRCGTPRSGLASPWRPRSACCPPSPHGSSTAAADERLRYACILEYMPDTSVRVHTSCMYAVAVSMP